MQKTGCIRVIAPVACGPNPCGHIWEIYALDIEPVVLADSTATVAEAARAVGVAEGQIVKTLALKVGGRASHPVRVFCDVSLRAFEEV
ncbi:hypothetical protein KMAL_17220 [Novacetimonas maltaceti]|uniref:Uncharacterized protein n=1 Tax=Novacetimonas maltaceti TaxID=1203393 RepID=A0A2S3W153_9PROT|nr:hypothetical protein KMAL_17220 [Novacetimonas maltaceti]